MQLMCEVWFVWICKTKMHYLRYQPLEPASRSKNQLKRADSIRRMYLDICGANTYNQGAVEIVDLS